MRELVLECSGEQADILTDALIEAGALSACAQDAELDTPNEQPMFGEPGGDASPEGWAINRIVALLPDGLDPEQLLEHTGELVSFELSPKWHLREVPDEDWVKLTQSQFEPINVGQRLVIVPTWHREQAQTGNRVRIELDPGLAFGTGSHPTTHLCLKWLQTDMPPASRLLDYGCGSGILAIAAKLLGAEDVVGVDIDEQAVQSTQFNASANGAAVRAMLPDELEPGKFDVVVANILSNPLKVLAPMLSNRVRDGGHLVLSGILARQAGEVAEFYAPWLKLAVYEALDGWVCLAGQRKGG
ncbi:MAG: 50S ribosomal protein L11 methyltransferase [Burkholderiaceae bacterium]|nr:50S ribosomal protein L11 methyltransferase [Burkholderiaceae bacterium]MCD8517859.1 50S ribosomal protein L11 methyltransferase [Burkholderiaceae bacterium]MCD8535986.1 50S ribosomal protein L11 methyltransferase [Burkholderiaceae bacterium]MCD8564603.1 50S ribosomal protein L11 methyltransferase [Burkholderiaceae bacterium]